MSRVIFIFLLIAISLMGGDLIAAENNSEPAKLIDIFRVLIMLGALAHGILLIKPSSLLCGLVLSIFPNYSELAHSYPVTYFLIAVLIFSFVITLQIIFSDLEFDEDDDDDEEDDEEVDYSPADIQYLITEATVDSHQNQSLVEALSKPEVINAIQNALNETSPAPGNNTAHPDELLPASNSTGKRKVSI